MDVLGAADRWARTWERAWPAKDVEAIAAMYASDATYRSHPLRNPEPGGADGYVRRQFAVEADVQCRFATPIAAGDRAADEWWASWIEQGRELSLVGATVLRFDPEGRVTEHVDYWVEGGGRSRPFAGWGG